MKLELIDTVAVCEDCRLDTATDAGRAVNSSASPCASCGTKEPGKRYPIQFYAVKAKEMQCESSE